MMPDHLKATAKQLADKQAADSKRLCAQIKTNGQQCEAFRLTDDRFCYFHARDRQRTLVIERAHLDRIARLNVGMPAAICHRQNTLNKDVFDETAAHLMHCLELPLLEDANAISVTATNIMRALATQHLDRRRAGTMFYGLQIVSGILKHIRTQPSDFRPKATADPEPLQQLKSMLSDLREKKKAAASAASSNQSPATQTEPDPCPAVSSA